MRKQVMRQRDLFEESVQGALVPKEMQPELVTQLAQLMYALIDVVERVRLGAGVASPFPLNGTFAVAPLALVDKARSPVNASTASGAKAMERTTCCPGFSVAGQPLTVEGYETEDT